MERMPQVRRWLRSLTWLAGLLAVAWGTSPVMAAEGWPPPLGKEKIVYTHAAWDGNTLVTNLSRILLEQMGYKVELKLVDTGLAYTAIASGTGDIWSGAWLPGQQSYLNKYGDKLDILAMAYLPTPGGLVVPGYAPIRSIEDLKRPEVKAKLGGKIIGIDAGSGIMITTARVLKDYGLDYELVPGSAAAMEAAFRSAYARNEWIVVTGWCPTAMCGKYDVKFLVDPKGIFSEYRNFHVVRRGFRADHPRAAAFLSRFTLYVDQLSRMILLMNEEKAKPDVVARQFIERNPELVYYWVGDLVPGFPKPASLQ